MSAGEESDQVAQRRANLDELKKLGVDPYPHRFDTQATIAAIVDEHGAKSGEELDGAGIEVRTAGRVLARRCRICCHAIRASLRASFPD